MKRFGYIPLLFVLLSMGACEKFLDVNKDMDLPSESTPNFLLPPVLGNLSTSHFDHGDVVAYFTQQVATLSGYDKYKDRWDYVDANRIAMWRRHYHDVGINALNLIASAEKENSQNYVAIGQIAFALSSLMTTDMFGDMPYSMAFQGNPSPKYDTQQAIYEAVHHHLDLGLAAITKYRQQPEVARKLSPELDQVYGGNLDDWERLAWAIKARALLHMTPNVKNGTADYDQVIEYADRALAGWKNAGYSYTTGNGTAMQMNQWGASQADPDWDYGNNILNVSAPTEFFLLTALRYDPATNTINDPRQPLLMTPRYTDPTSGQLQYLYVVPTQGKDGTKANDQYPNLFNNYVTGDAAPMNWFTREELLFIKAEAAFNKGDRSTAYSVFVEAIREHMRHVGVDATATANYLASDAVPAAAADLSLSHVLMQKYIALFLQPEVWVDMRRYNYDPQLYTGLKRPENLVWYWADEEPTVWLQRLPYDTETEEIYNLPTLQELGAYQNPDWLKKKMIWAK